MANENSDLWPSDLVVNVLTPAMILNEQAEALAKRTQAIVKGEIQPGRAGKFAELHFDLVAPAVGTRRRILRVRYSEEFPYPVVLIAAPLHRDLELFNPRPVDYVSTQDWKLSSDEEQQARLANAPNEVREFLKIIFNAPTTRATLFSLIARSNEATATVKGEEKPLEEPSQVPATA